MVVEDHSRQARKIGVKKRHTLHMQEMKNMDMAFLKNINKRSKEQEYEGTVKKLNNLDYRNMIILMSHAENLFVLTNFNF